ncbi:MAG: aldo/keto reductase [Succinivibrio sp.]|nr:aldo/keto reductase [Succinivibrio sp.]
MSAYVKLKNSLNLPKFGLGLWDIGESRARAEQEADSIRYALEHGVQLFDTAEMYGMGRSESFLGAILKDYERSSLFVISKVLPSHAGRGALRQACEGSLRRLGTDYLDCYLYHWIGATPFEEVIAGMESLVQAGLIRSWGVSNFDTADLKELIEDCQGTSCVINQVLYHLGSRGIEYSLLPYMQEKQVIPMAYCPLAQGGGLCQELYSCSEVLTVARAHNVSAAQVLLAFVLARQEMVAIPKSGSLRHLQENLAAAELRLSEAELALLDRSFPAPDRKTPLDVV